MEQTTNRRRLFGFLAALPFVSKLVAKPKLPEGHEILKSFDARDWAKYWMICLQHNPSIAADEECMVTWFANALMRGYDEFHHRRYWDLPENQKSASQIVYYGPHACATCGVLICKRGFEFGGKEFDYPEWPIYPNTEWQQHFCDRQRVKNLPKPVARNATSLPKPIGAGFPANYRRGCKLAGPGRGDCEHFIGFPKVYDTTTTDEYGVPHGWCDFCWVTNNLRIRTDFTAKLLQEKQWE